nr:hypothetical protein KitaXyl93_62630 [Kitasatospora sp. Xyl93]
MPGLPVLILSERAEQRCARALPADGAGGINHFLKESVFDGDRFVGAPERVGPDRTAVFRDCRSVSPPHPGRRRPGCGRPGPAGRGRRPAGRTR